MLSRRVSVPTPPTLPTGAGARTFEAMATQPAPVPGDTTTAPPLRSHVTTNSPLSDAGPGVATHRRSRSAIYVVAGLLALAIIAVAGWRVMTTTTATAAPIPTATPTPTPTPTPTATATPTPDWTAAASPTPPATPTPAAAAAPTTTPTATPTLAPSARAKPKPKVNCNPPFTVDSNGRQHYKPECNN